jgi:hypothetical protein
MEARVVAERAWLVAHAAATCYQAHWTEAYASFGALNTIGNNIEADASAHDAGAIQDQIANAHDETGDLNKAWVGAGQDCP